MFETSFTGSSKNLLDAIAVLSEHSINLNTLATAKVGDRFVIKFLSGSEEEVRRMRYTTRTDPCSSSQCSTSLGSG